MLKGKAKRVYQREYMRKRRGLISEATLSVDVRPNQYLLAHIEAYPEGFINGKYRADYNPEFDPFINPMAIPNNEMFLPKSSTFQPKLPWYAGAENHFGEVRNKRYARQFFSNLRGIGW